MKVVIAEKPSVASIYAKALCVNKKQNGYYEGNGYIVTWCIGHLVELASTSAYSEEYKRWKLTKDEYIWNGVAERDCHPFLWR